MNTTWKSVALLLVSSFAFIGCGTSGRSPTVSQLDTTDSGTEPIDRCSTPNDGCPCENPGDAVDCGEVARKYTEYVVCSEGKRTCSADGSWGVCVVTSDSLETKSLTGSTNSYHIQSLGTNTTCTPANACDPYACSTFVDTPRGTALGDGGAKLADGGLTTVTKLVPATVCSSLSISGPTALTVTQLSPTVSPNTATFTATLAPAGCFPGATPALWSIDRYDLATIDTTGKITLVTPLAVPIKVTAYAGTLSATATMNVKVDITDVSSAPTGYTASTFLGTLGAADTATFLYPYSNTVLPLGLLPPVPQWSTGLLGGAAAVKLTLRYPATGTTLFSWSEVIPENNAMFLDPPTNSITLAAAPRGVFPATAWSLFEQTAQGNTGAIVLQRKILATLLSREISVPVTFATGQLKGTVYYQSYGTRLVQNYSSTYSPQAIGGGARFGAATLSITPGSSYPGVAAGYTSADGPGCRVCHSASADGSTLLTNLFSSTNSAIFRLATDPASGGTSFPANASKYAWGALYPDGSFMLSNSGPSSSYSVLSTPGLDGSDNGAFGPALYNTVPTSPNFGLATMPAVSGLPSGLKVALPVFSPDGTKAAFNHWAGTISGQAGDHRSLAMADFTNSTKAFSNFRRLFNEPTTACNTLFHATDPCTSVWPTFLPDSSGVIFEREVFNDGRVVGANHADFGGTRSGCDGTSTCGDDGTKGELWYVSTASSPVSIRLNQANGRDPSTGTITIPTGTAPHTTTIETELDYEPTINPVEVGGYYWVAFTSRRLYGNIATLNPWWSDPRFKPIGGGACSTPATCGSGGPTPKKIWVAAIKKGATGAIDPSYPAFYLPGQELLAGNSKAYWVNAACKAPSVTLSAATLCDTNLDCCGGGTTSVCALDTPVANPPTHHCISTTSSACVADGAACTADVQCCNFATSGSRCGSGVCTLPPSIALYQEGSFSRDFFAQCPASQKPIFRLFEWKALIPTGTSIDFTAQNASSSAGLAGAASYAVATATPPNDTAWTSGPDTIDAILRANSVVPQNYLRVTFKLHPSSDKRVAPSIITWRQTYDCVDTR